MYQQIHDVGYKAAQDVYERKLREIQTQVKNSDDKARLINQAYEDTIRQLQIVRNEFENTLNTKAKDIIIKSCEKVLQTHLKDPEFVQDYLKSFISQFNEEQDVILRLSPDMFSRVEANIPMLESSNTKIKLHVTTDPTMSMFGCVVETENQRLDLQLDNQLSNLKNLIEGL
jgi:flagellar biosynthesis/type III secretory pathway protein FliH